MDFRTSLIIAGIFLLAVSLFVGDWTIWVGTPLLILGAIFYFIEKE